MDITVTQSRNSHEEQVHAALINESMSLNTHEEQVHAAWLMNRWQIWSDGLVTREPTLANG